MLSMRGTRAIRSGALALLAGAAACERVTVLEATTGAGGATVVVGAPGNAFGVGRGAGELLGRWTRVSTAASGGVLTELTWTFLADGSGARTTVTRTLLGATIAVDQAPFTWTGGAGVLILRFPQTNGFDTVLRAGYQVEAGLTGTTLRLDGATYARASG